VDVAEDAENQLDTEGIKQRGVGTCQCSLEQDDLVQEAYMDVFSGMSTYLMTLSKENVGQGYSW